MKSNVTILLSIVGLFLLVLAGAWYSRPATPEPEAFASLPDDVAVPAARELIAHNPFAFQPLQPHLVTTPEVAPAPEPEPMQEELPTDPDKLREWARETPDQALEWLETAPADETRDIVVEMVCARVAESNPAQAVSLAETYSGGASNLLENFFHQWAERDDEAATAYVVAKPPGAERDRLLSRLVLVRSRDNPADAARLVLEWISPGDIQNEAAISVLHQWALQDPIKAADWAQSFTDNALRDRALNEVAAPLSRAFE